MERSDIEALEGAVLALNRRELDSFVGLMADDMVWEAQTHRLFWWRPTPS